MAWAGRWRRVVGGALLAVAVGTTCSDAPAPDERPGRLSRCDIEGLPACGNGCGAGALCVEGCCHRACTDPADCAGAPGCDGFGCACEEGACIPTACSASAECAKGEHCVGGSCLVVEEVEVASCRLLPPWETLRPGTEFRPALVAFDAEGRRIVPTPSYRLEVSDAHLASVADGIVLGGEGEGIVEVLARVGRATCTAELESLGALPDGRARVVVLDALSRLPVEGARVQVEAGGDPVVATTDARGVAAWALDALPPPPWTISVFHEDRRYVTLVGVSEPDVLVPLWPNPDRPLAAGFSGRFHSSRFEPSRLNFGLAGATIPGNLVDLDVFVLVGPVETVPIDIGGARSADLSAGLVFGLGNTWFKERYRVEAVPGACADREASRKGRCGVRTAWGLAGGIPLEDLPLDAIESRQSVEAGRLLAELLPHVRRLQSAIVPSVELEALPRKSGAPDFAALPTLDLHATERLALRVQVRLSPLPESYVDGAIGLVGARVPQEGLVPLGLTGAVVQQGSREVVDPVRGRRGVLDLRFAPLHGGIEGSEYVVLVLALDLEGLSGGKPCRNEDRAGCTPIAGLLASARSLPWGTEVDLAAQGFLGFADAARFDAAARRLEVGATPEGTTLLRLELVSAGRAWEVFFPADRSAIELPVPVGAADRLDDPAGTLQAMDVDLDLDALVAPGAVDLADFTLRTRRFSSMDLPR